MAIPGGIFAGAGFVTNIDDGRGGAAYAVLVPLGLVPLIAGVLVAAAGADIRSRGFAAVSSFSLAVRLLLYALGLALWFQLPMFLEYME
jgi:hypothetical protein